MNNSRRDFFKKAGVVLAGLSLGELSKESFAAVGKNKPNVLFLAVDDWNDWTGPMGDKQVKTPNLDRLATRGVTFTNAHCPGVYCAPSRTAIMTGLHPTKTGFYAEQPHFTLRPQAPTIHSWFKKHGYAVYGTGKIYHHMPGFVDLRGWDEFYVRTEQQKLDGWPMGSWDYGAPMPAKVPNSPLHKGKVGFESFLEYAELPNEAEEEMADTIRANWAAGMLKKKYDKPFFMAFGLYAPHRANYVPKKYYDLYPLDSIKAPIWKDDDLEDVPDIFRKPREVRKTKIHDVLVKRDAVKATLQGYFAAISYADAMMGRVLDALEKGGHAKNTVIVLWSDNGYHHGEKGHWGKKTLWERTSNVPFMWAGPGVVKGAKINTTVSLIDTFQTLIDLCGLPEIKSLDGVSLAKDLAKPASAKDRDVVVAYAEYGSMAVINQNWRYIRYADNSEELYDLKTDPHEWYNLAGKKEYAKVNAGMAKSLPSNPAKAGPQKGDGLKLAKEGQSFKWVPSSGNGGSKKKK